jgi:hypothetical protein
MEKLQPVQKPPQRIYSSGYLLYEYMPDDKRYQLVGAIDIPFGNFSADLETENTPESAAEEFLQTGKVRISIRVVKDGL